MAEDPDLELLEAWRGGDKEAANILLSRHFSNLRTYFLQRVSGEHEDLIQETFANIIAAKDQFRGEAPFRVYLFTIARNVLFKHLRERYQLDARIDPMEDDASIADMTGRRHSSLLAEREEHRLLLDALRQIPLRYQELLELYYWQRMSGPEVAAFFGVPEPTVRSRLRTALNNLRQRYVAIAGAPHQRELKEEHVTTWLRELALSLEARSIE